MKAPFQSQEEANYYLLREIANLWFYLFVAGVLMLSLCAIVWDENRRIEKLEQQIKQSQEKK